MCVLWKGTDLVSVLKKQKLSSSFRLFFPNAEIVFTSNSIKAYMISYPFVHVCVCMFVCIQVHMHILWRSEVNPGCCFLVLSTLSFGLVWDRVSHWSGTWWLGLASWLAGKLQDSSSVSQPWDSRCWLPCPGLVCLPPEHLPSTHSPLCESKGGQCTVISLY